MRNVHIDTCKTFRETGENCNDHRWHAEERKDPCPHDTLTAFNPYCTLRMVKPTVAEGKIEIVEEKTGIEEQVETQTSELIEESSPEPESAVEQATEAGWNRVASLPLSLAQELAGANPFETEVEAALSLGKQTGRPDLHLNTSMPISTCGRSSIESGSYTSRSETPMSAALRSGRKLLERIPSSYQKRNPPIIPRPARSGPKIPQIPLGDPTDKFKSQLSRPGTPSQLPQPASTGRFASRPLAAASPSIVPIPRKKASDTSALRDPADEMPLFLTKNTKQAIPIKKATGPSIRSSSKLPPPPKRK